MKVIARLPALAGPRTFVAQGLTEESASLIFDLVTREGGMVVIGRDGPRVNMELHLARVVKPKAPPRAKQPLLSLASNG